MDGNVKIASMSCEFGTQNTNFTLSKHMKIKWLTWTIICYRQVVEMCRNKIHMSKMQLFQLSRLVSRPCEWFSYNILTCINAHVYNRGFETSWIFISPPRAAQQSIQRCRYIFYLMVWSDAKGLLYFSMYLRGLNPIKSIFGTLCWLEKILPQKMCSWREKSPVKSQKGYFLYTH